MGSFKATGDYTHHESYSWTAEPEAGALEGDIVTLTTASTADANLWVYLCKDPEFYGTIGLAWVGTLCSDQWLKGYRAGINEKRENVLVTAEVR